MRVDATRKYLAWGLVALLLLPAIADFAAWSLWRQRLQDDVDQAAKGAATALEQGRPIAPAALRWVDPRRLALTSPPVIERPPRSGYYRGLPNAVRIRATTVRAPFFSSLVFGPRPMTAEATAAVIPTHRPGGTRAALLE